MTIFSRTKPTPHQKVWSTEHPEFGTIRFIAKQNCKTLRISVPPHQGVQVVLPLRFPKRKAEQLLTEKQNWIRTAIRNSKITEEKARHFYESFSPPRKRDIRESLVSRLNILASQYGFSYNKVSIRDQRTRWGSCSHQNNISLNQKLYFLPPELRDYVLLHELAHTVEKNHSPGFWTILYKISGKEITQQARRSLKDFDYLFYPPSANESVLSKTF